MPSIWRMRVCTRNCRAYLRAASGVRASGYQPAAFEWNGFATSVLRHSTATGDPRPADFSAARHARAASKTSPRVTIVLPFQDAVGEVLKFFSKRARTRAVEHRPVGAVRRSPATFVANRKAGWSLLDVERSFGSDDLHPFIDPVRCFLRQKPDVLANSDG